MDWLRSIRRTASFEKMLNLKGLYIQATLKMLANLKEHTERELRLAGMFDKDADYGGAIATAVTDLMEVFASQGHSGGSAVLTIDLFNKLSQFQNLTPLTSNSDEWNDVSEFSGEPMWQSNRNPSIFSEDAGKTWYGVEDK